MEKQSCHYQLVLPTTLASSSTSHQHNSVQSARMCMVCMAFGSYAVCGLRSAICDMRAVCERRVVCWILIYGVRPGRVKKTQVRSEKAKSGDAASIDWLQSNIHSRFTLPPLDLLFPLSPLLPLLPLFSPLYFPSRLNRNSGIAVDSSLELTKHSTLNPSNSLLGGSNRDIALT